MQYLAFLWERHRTRDSISIDLTKTEEKADCSIDLSRYRLRKPLIDVVTMIIEAYAKLERSLRGC